MSEIEEKDGVEEKTPPRLARPGRLELRKTVETGQVRQSFSHGRSKAVTVEVRRKRTFAPGEGGRMTEVVKSAPKIADTPPAAPKVAESETPAETGETVSRRTAAPKTLTVGEKETRARALETALREDQEARQQAVDTAEKERAENEAKLEAEAQVPSAEEPPPVVEEPIETRTRKAPPAKAAPERARGSATAPDEGDAERARGKRGKGDPRRSTLAPRRDFPRRRSGKLTIGQALIEEDRVRSLASMRRARARERQAHQQKAPAEPVKVVREVVVPEVITVQELANRMAVRGADVVKVSTKLGTPVTVAQSIDADTAELLVEEFGHKVRRVSAADVEIGLKRERDDPGSLKPRPPVVTVMGHVDHGKTSLLDALRQTDVVSGEAGGITQHIGAYQVTSSSGGKITFVDTPGHEAFSAMRARGATVTDIVVLVVAADDGVMPQTVEAINHARAAEVPIIVAINKSDKPAADPGRVRNDLLQHEVVVEEMGGEVLSIEVSATQKLNLDKLEEAILLQAELLDLKANPEGEADGIVIESRLDRGRGPVATVLVQNGTLRVGDIIVAGVEWARVRALLDDHGRNTEAAGPSVPVEVLGLGGAPTAGDEFVTVENERRAREVTEYRQELLRELRAAAGARGTLEQMFADINAGQAAELPIVIKADVQGSVEAIVASLEKLGTEEVSVQILHSGVGGINESDVTLAEASKALIIGFNVRANAQARSHAGARGIDIRYYSVIYDLIDDIKTSLSGMLAPTLREKITGNAQVLQVFEISKLGKIAGCRVTDGVIRRGAKVRLIRDDSVIHEGKLSTLRRFKDDVREVKDGLECGMSFENYHDIREGDVIESVEVEEIARTL